MTVILVAHRLSTIKDANEIVMLGDGGLILEKGTFSQLIKNNGAFAKLAKK